MYHYFIEIFKASLISQNLGNGTLFLSHKEWYLNPHASVADF